MATLPLSLVAPALGAAGAYLNARFQVYYDLDLLRSVIPAVLNQAWWMYRGRLNFFYRFEDLALEKTSQNRDFLRFEDRSYTYAQAYDIVLRYAAWLKEKRGVKKGEMVALDFQNTDTLLFLVLALWSLGAVPALINYNLLGKPLVHCITKAKSKLVLIDPSVAGNVGDDVKTELSDTTFEVVTPQLDSQIQSLEPYRAPDEVRSDAAGRGMAMLIYTSGTTGLPKAAIISWSKVAIPSGFSSRWVGTTKNDTFYTAMPLYHSTAMLLGFTHTLSRGATFAMSRKFSTSHFWDDVRKHDASIIQYVGETCRYLLSAPVRLDPVTGENLDRKHNVRVAFGNGLRPDVWDKFKERFGVETICEFYASTEGSFGTWNKSRNGYSLGAVGRNGALYNAILGHSVAVVRVDIDTEQPFRDPETGLCVRVNRGEPGELLFALPPKDVEARFHGYFGDDDATSKKIMRSVIKNGDAWFRTGDVVRWDAENRLYFTDRIGDTFRWKSENVSTAEVAQAVGLHPSIQESNVYGVELPNHEGRAGCAAVIFRASALDSNGVPTSETLKSLAEHVRGNLPKYALPLFLRLVQDDSAHSTGTNKQQKTHLRNEGVDPEKTKQDQVYWLKGDSYVHFERSDWDELRDGKVKL